MASSFQHLVKLQQEHEWGLTVMSRLHLYKIWILQLLYQDDLCILVLVSKLEKCLKPARLIEMHYFFTKDGEIKSRNTKLMRQ